MGPRAQEGAGTVLHVNGNLAPHILGRSWLSAYRRPPGPQEAGKSGAAVFSFVPLLALRKKSRVDLPGHLLAPTDSEALGPLPTPKTRGSHKPEDKPPSQQWGRGPGDRGSGVLIALPRGRTDTALGSADGLPLQSSRYPVGRIVSKNAQVCGPLRESSTELGPFPQRGCQGSWFSRPRLCESLNFLSPGKPPHVGWLLRAGSA